MAQHNRFNTTNITDVHWVQPEDEVEEQLEYKFGDMVLRVAAKELMMEQDTDLMPHRRADVERMISHVVFELAYRTGTVQEYIEMHRDAVLLDEVA